MDTNKKRPQLLSMLISVILTIGLMPAAAFATSSMDRYGNDLAEYQLILDKLNEEYGVTFAFVNEWDVKNIRGLTIPTPTDLGTLAEFERIMRSACIEAAGESRRNEDEWNRALGTSEAFQLEWESEYIRDEDGYIIGFIAYPSGSQGSSTRGTVKGVGLWKDWSYAYGNRTNNGSDWVWSSVSSLAYWPSGVNPMFVPYSNPSPQHSGTGKSILQARYYGKNFYTIDPTYGIYLGIEQWTPFFSYNCNNMY